MKSPFQSKTLWAALIVALSAFVPPVHDFIVAHPDYFSMALGGLFGLLRLVTKEKLVIE